MTPSECEQLKNFRTHIHSLLSNQLTLAKVVTSLSETRALTKDEIRRIHQCLEDAILRVDAEISMLLWSLKDRV
jgi:hypothetical protein